MIPPISFLSKMISSLMFGVGAAILIMIFLIMIYILALGFLEE